MLVHIDETVHNGHIFCYARSPDSLWYKYDDTSVTKTNLETVLCEHDSYILCYTKSGRDTIVSHKIEVDENLKELSQLPLLSTSIHHHEKISEIVSNDSNVR